MINIAFVIAGSVLAAAPCESLKSLALPGTIITAAELVPAGPYTIPTPAGGPPAAAAGGRGPAPAPAPLGLPARCRVAAVLNRLPIQRSRWKPGCHVRTQTSDGPAACAALYRGEAGHTRTWTTDFRLETQTCSCYFQTLSWQIDTTQIDSMTR